MRMITASTGMPTSVSPLPPSGEIWSVRSIQSRSECPPPALTITAARALSSAAAAGWPLTQSLSPLVGWPFLQASGAIASWFRFVVETACSLPLAKIVTPISRLLAGRGSHPRRRRARRHQAPPVSAALRQRDPVDDDRASQCSDPNRRSWLIQADQAVIAVVPPQTSWQALPTDLDGAIFTGGGPLEWQGPGKGFKRRPGGREQPRWLSGACRAPGPARRALVQNRPPGRH